MALPCITRDTPRDYIASGSHRRMFLELFGAAALHDVSSARLTSFCDPIPPRQPRNWIEKAPTGILHHVGSYQLHCQAPPPEALVDPRR